MTFQDKNKMRNSQGKLKSHRDNIGNFAFSDAWEPCICHSGDPDSGESPIALVEILIAISPSGNSDPLITSLKINRYCIIMKFVWMESKLSFIRLCKMFVD